MTKKEKTLKTLSLKMDKLKDKIDMIKSMDIGECYHLELKSLPPYNWMVGIIDEFDSESLCILLLVFQKVKGATSYQYFPHIQYENIKSIKPTTMKDLPLYVNEHTTTIYNQSIAGEPLTIAGKIIPFKGMRGEYAF